MTVYGPKHCYREWSSCNEIIEGFAYRAGDNSWHKTSGSYVAPNTSALQSVTMPLDETRWYDVDAWRYFRSLPPIKQGGYAPSEFSKDLTVYFNGQQILFLLQLSWRYKEGACDEKQRTMSYYAPYYSPLVNGHKEIREIKIRWQRIARQFSSTPTKIPFGFLLTSELIPVRMELDIEHKMSKAIRPQLCVDLDDLHLHLKIYDSLDYWNPTSIWTLKLATREWSRMGKTFLAPVAVVQKQMIAAHLAEYDIPAEPIRY